jgi:hypothetical protein
MDGNERFNQKVRRMLGVTDDTIPVEIITDTETEDEWCDTCVSTTTIYSITVGDHHKFIRGLHAFLSALDLQGETLPDHLY